MTRRGGVGGMCASERVVMGRWDGGASIEQIAAATGLTPERVRRIVSVFHPGVDEERAQISAAASGSARLRDAILAQMAARAGAGA